MKVTLAEGVDFTPAIRIEGRVVLERGSDVVWFTFPAHWHDIGRFHRADGTFTGIYANILTPVEIPEPGVWHTTDLFLDLWLPPDGPPRLLDEDEFEEARARGWIDPATAESARAEAKRLLQAARAGVWPPEPVRTWTLARAHEAAGAASGQSSSATDAAQRRSTST